MKYSPPRGFPRVEFYQFNSSKLIDWVMHKFPNFRMILHMIQQVIKVCMSYLELIV